MKKIILILSLAFTLTNLVNAQCTDPVSTVSQSYNGAVLSSFDVTVNNHSSNVQYYVYTYYLNGQVVNSINSNSPNMNFPVQTSNAGHLHVIGVRAYCWDGSISEEDIILPIEIATVADVSGFNLGEDEAEYEEGLLSPCNAHYTIIYIRELRVYVKAFCYCHELEVYSIFTTPHELFELHFSISEEVTGLFWLHLLYGETICSKPAGKKSPSLSSSDENSNVVLPNPLQKGQIISISNDITGILLVNLIGETCFENQNQAGINELVVPDNISSGIYFLILNQQGQSSSQKVMIK